MTTIDVRYVLVIKIEDYCYPFVENGVFTINVPPGYKDLSSNVQYELDPELAKHAYKLDNSIVDYFHQQVLKAAYPIIYKTLKQIHVGKLEKKLILSNQEYVKIEYIIPDNKHPYTILIK